MKNKNKIVFKEPLSKKLVLIKRYGALIFSMWVENQTFRIFWSVFTLLLEQFKDLVKILKIISSKNVVKIILLSFCRI